MKVLAYIANFLVMVIAAITSVYIFTKGYILESPRQMLAGILIMTVAVFCAICYDEYRYNDDVDYFIENIKKTLHKLCEE